MTIKEYQKVTKTFFDKHDELNLLAGVSILAVQNDEDVVILVLTQGSVGNLSKTIKSVALEPCELGSVLKLALADLSDPEKTSNNK